MKALIADGADVIPRALQWVGDTDGCLELIDQRRLPVELVSLQCRSVEQLVEAIKTLAVRGAPAIGVAAAYGLVLALQGLPTGASIEQALEVLNQAHDRLTASRPTAVNLFWALQRVQQKAFQAASSPAINLQALRETVLAEANAIYEQDVDMCKRIGQNGEKFIENGFGILTHCNTGALATAGQGTALSVILEAHKKGKKFTVYVDETRPLLQGSRLTAWELQQANINTIVICDNMAGWLMKQGKINVVLTGADRIAANGDTANKIGTYSLCILAKKHRIPFYVAAPSTTFDLNIKAGAEIPIEQRDPQEVTTFAGIQSAPDNVKVYNPAFDITDARYINAIITEKGVIKNPNTHLIREHLR
jgi:methylthioribose-1-phosphate isomerase